jgi:hypothetical protein
MQVSGANNEPCHLEHENSGADCEEQAAEVQHKLPHKREGFSRGRMPALPWPKISSSVMAKAMVPRFHEQLFQALQPTSMPCEWWGMVRPSAQYSCRAQRACTGHGGAASPTSMACSSSVVMCIARLTRH